MVPIQTLKIIKPTADNYVDLNAVMQPCPMNTSENNQKTIEFLQLCPCLKKMLCNYVFCIRPTRVYIRSSTLFNNAILALQRSRKILSCHLPLTRTYPNGINTPCHGDS